MDWNGIYGGIRIGLLASIPLGPIGLLCIQKTLQKGRLAGFVSGLGAATSDTLYAIIAGFSLSYIVVFIEKQIFWLQLLGGVILIVLGIKIFRSNPAVQLRKQRKGKTNLVQDYVTTFLWTISNPVALFIFMAFFAGFRALDPNAGIIGQLLLILGVFIGAAGWWLILTTIVGFFRAAVNLRRLYWINKIAGLAIIILVIIALSVWLIKDYIIK
ncbi:MAG: LysE family transporter [Marinilabiliaceae bacterium]|nr:LysE family transporter [Marinilabiliaceae bacterium]